MKKQVHYSDELADKILSFVENGGTVSNFCRTHKNAPTPSGVYRWYLPSCAEYKPDFAKKMADAKLIGKQRLLDDLNDWTNPDLIDSTLRTDKGVMPNAAEVQKYDMCVKHRQWLLSKQFPAEFSANPHRHINIAGNTAAEKLASILSLTAAGDLSVQAGALFAQLIKEEANAGELKQLAESIKQLAGVAESITNKSMSTNGVINVSSNV